MVFHIAICSADAALRSRLQRICMDYYSRRTDACIVEQLPDAAALLGRDAAGMRYNLYLIELGNVPAPAGMAAAVILRGRGRRAVVLLPDDGPRLHRVPRVRDAVLLPPGAAGGCV